MWRSLLRTFASAPSTTIKPPSSPSPTLSHLCSSRDYSVKSNKAVITKAKKGKSKSDAKSDTSSSAVSAADEFDDEDVRARRLAEDESDRSLDVGPNGRPLFTSTPSLSQLSRTDTCTYMKFSMEELNAVLPEGLPLGMVKEFEESKQTALLVRRSFLDLRDNFRRIVDPPLQSFDAKDSKVRKQIVLDGPVSCGKSIALAMLVHWARDEGWLVVYVPNGREWTHGGVFYKNQQTGFWDTPVQAATALQDFLKYNESRLQQLPCKISDPIPLGEGAGVGWMKGVDSMAMPEGSTLYDLIQTGVTHTHAAVGVLVHLRKELSLVKDIPILLAIDQVNAFRSMMHNDMMVGAFSHSTAVGKLRKDLPDVPADARINFTRYNLDEAASVCHYYLRQRLVRREAFSEEGWKKIFYLSNGNGSEMRWLLPFMR
ncbi:uncharacterized protein LOC131308242 isoform X2 [Rhododendron vialii]|uniref:uncharacterized protein LOC131308242 isoform X2 n=1 Tax=Rhododendron vialii TaxID=182163 RepID=UPI00265E6C40|nr:uncharacterized protein LOC131308242 isoform X2 [Rhododendron vialii]